jgi:hypothetical protein
MKTSELTGNALDWAVAKCEGTENCWGRSRLKPYEMRRGVAYSKDWAHGGPIIEREHISIEATRIGGLGDRWMAVDSGDCTEFADAPLIAAMRCYVASKLGDDVDVPEELCPPTA